MAAEIRIPKLGMSVTEVTLVEWMFGDGETVEGEAFQLVLEQAFRLFYFC